MNIVDFTHEHIEQASALALVNYEEERRFVPVLPQVDVMPDLTHFADNGLGVAVVDGDTMLGFLCCVTPFENVFSATDVRGVFSPMGANAAVKENRAKIYAAMYQAAAKKWVRTGAVSHAVCLYAHDTEAQQQFYKYGFGLRCVDAVRPMEQIDCKPCGEFNFAELKHAEFPSVYQLELSLNRHYKESPCFMNRTPDTPEEFERNCADKSVRYFTATHRGELCAFMKIVTEGETFITQRHDARHIGGAFCLPEYRGKGVYQNLMNFTIKTLCNEGYTHLGVDFESFNPTANGFWLKYFTAYTHGVVRRIDERILE